MSASSSDEALIAQLRRKGERPVSDWATLLDRAADALEAAQDWKAQAMTVLSEWEATYEAAGSPGRLGQWKAVALREEVERLRALSAHPDAIPSPESDAYAAFEDWEQEMFRHQPVLSMHDGGIAGCQCLDRVFVKGREDWGTHLAQIITARLRALSSHPTEETVTTVEELDALPVGSFVISASGVGYYRRPSGWLASYNETVASHLLLEPWHTSQPIHVLFRPVPEGSGS